MNTDGHIYQGSEEKPVKPEDAARLEGYLRGRAESDAKLIAEEFEERAEGHRAVLGEEERFYGGPNGYAAHYHAAETYDQAAAFVRSADPLSDPERLALDEIRERLLGEASKAVDMQTYAAFEGIVDAALQHGDTP